MPKLDFKKGNVCVLVDPVTKNRIWVPLEKVHIVRNGVEMELGKYLDDLEENTVTQAEFNEYKIQQKKIQKRFLDILKINVGQTEVNSLDVNELLDNMEEK